MEKTYPKPFLRWAGSKKKLLPHLVNYWDSDKFSRYIEPFAGSAQLYFTLDHDSAILNDINSELINTYKVIKERPSDLHNALLVLPHNKEFYYELRKRPLVEMTKIERAARFVFLNKLCFNGLYRTNNKGEFNVPFSASKPSKFPSEEELLMISSKLKNTELLSEDFEEMLRRHVRKNDFVYLDPPYALANSKIFHQYNAVTFGLEDISRLHALLEFLDSKEVRFLLSYAYSEEILYQFNKWHTQKVATQRNIAGFSKDRRIAEELLISNCYEKY